MHIELFFFLSLKVILGEFLDQRAGDIVGDYNVNRVFCGYMFKFSAVDVVCIF